MTPRLTITVTPDTTDRWAAEVPTIPGSDAFGATPELARRAAMSATLRILADRLDTGGKPHALLDALFEPVAKKLPAE